jgi:hypothetical protein
MSLFGRIIAKYQIKLSPGLSMDQLALSAVIANPEANAASAMTLS